MDDEFVDIKIATLDDKASNPSRQGALMNLVLRLSASAPAAWSEYFNEAWAQHLYMMKRRALASGSTITITCMPAELETDHLPELKKVIAEANSSYRAFVARKRHLEAQEQEEARRQQEELSALKNKLKFD